MELVPIDPHVLVLLDLSCRAKTASRLRVNTNGRKRSTHARARTRRARRWRRGPGCQRGAGAAVRGVQALRTAVAVLHADEMPNVRIEIQADLAMADLADRRTGQTSG